MEKLYEFRLLVNDVEIRDKKRWIIVLCDRLKELDGSYEQSTGGDTA